MIKKIYVNNIGSLRDFSNDESPFPSGNIIIHGMNGSGKSQLSSVLQKISKLRNASQLGLSNIESTKSEIADYLIKRKSREVSSDENIEAKIDDFNFNIDVSKISVNYNGNFPKLFVFNEEYVLENRNSYPLTRNRTGVTRVLLTSYSSEYNLIASHPYPEGMSMLVTYSRVLYH